MLLAIHISSGKLHFDITVPDNVKVNNKRQRVVTFIKSAQLALTRRHKFMIF